MSWSQELADRLLHQLGPSGEVIDIAPAAGVFAHPDDEAIGLGGQMWRFQNITVIHVTDGAPDDIAHICSRGFPSRDEYRNFRSAELSKALDVAGVPSCNRMNLGVIDMQAHLHMVRISRQLLDIFTRRNIEIIFTHTYEGGHPDHDTTAFCVHMAARLLEKSGQPHPVIIEMPYYRKGHCKEPKDVWQRFTLMGGDMQHIVFLDDWKSRRIKQRMLKAHASQEDILKHFRRRREYFRQAPRYDFTQLPNQGALSELHAELGLTPERWQELVLLARQEMEV